MSVSFYLKRSATPSKRPLAVGIGLGELALNYDSATGGLYYKDSTDSVVKVGPAQVSLAAPNSSPAGSSGNSVGEFWYDTTTSVLKIWSGSAWIATNTNSDYVANSAYTAKGVLLVGSAPNTPIALAVGTNGYALVADSSTASGLSWISVGGTGTVTSITAGTGLTGGTITTTGTIALADTAVSAGSYTNSSFTVDAQGRLTAASSGTAPVTNVTATGPITSSGGTTPVISTSMATNKLLGRSTASTGVAEEITIGTNLTLSTGTLSSPAYATIAQMGGVTTTATLTAGSTSITVASGAGILVGDTVSGTGIALGTKVSAISGTSVTLDTIATAPRTTSPITFYTSEKVINPGIDGPGLAKAWCVFNMGTSGVWPGGSTTGVRLAGSSTVTATTTNNHGLFVGSRVYNTGGMAAAQLYIVTSVPTLKTFTFVTVATTASSGALNIDPTLIVSSYNISTVFNGGGSAPSFANAPWFNFANTLADTNYCPLSLGSNNTFASPSERSSGWTKASFSLNYILYTGALQATGLMSVVVFGY